MNVTAEQVREAATAAGIRSVPSHDCSLCGRTVWYHIKDGALYFDSGCDCVFNPDSIQPRDWSAAAEWINMQSDEGHARRIAAAFGLS